MSDSSSNYDTVSSATECSDHEYSSDPIVNMLQNATDSVANIMSACASSNELDKPLTSTSEEGASEAGSSGHERKSFTNDVPTDFSGE